MRINQAHSKGYSKGIITSLDKLFSKTTSLSPIEISNTILKHNLNEHYTIKGFRNFLQYCLDNDFITKSLLDEYYQKVKFKEKPNSRDLYVPNKEKIVDFLREIKKRNYHEYVGIKILLETGCRLTELEYFTSLSCENEIIENKVVSVPISYLRGNKNSYFLFLTEKTYLEYKTISQEMKGFNFGSLKTYIKRHKLVPLKYLRKFIFTLMIECEIDFEIANFIQGRVSKNVGMNHYLAKRQLGIKQYSKIVEKINEVYLEIEK